VRLRRVLLAAGATVTAAGLAGGLAIASSPSGGSPPGAWQDYRSAPFTYAAGEVCSFGVHGDIVKDEERVRNLLTYPDGTPQEQEFTGPLFVRFSNQSSGKSVVRDLSGTGWFFYTPAGALQYGHGFEHMSLSIHKVNTSPAPGEYYLSGEFDFAINADKTRDFTLEHGSAENLCLTLA
jgi:hypothetical protein